MTDEHFMKMALTLAEKGRGYTSPNPMVGAVVVKDGNVVGQGWHRAVGGPHAEVEALDGAGTRARGGVIYVTLEPCNHTGRTPPCTRKILGAGIREVVMAMEDPNPDVAGGGAGFLRDRGVAVTGGICQDEALQLNESFVKYARTRTPFVVMKSAATLDGRIATRTGHSRWVTGPAARGHVHQLRHALDAIMVGIGTIQADDPRLTARLADGGGNDPVRIVLDTHLSINPDAGVLTAASTAETLVITGPAVDGGKKKRIRREGVQIVPAAVADGRIDLGRLMIQLGAMGITSILLEGGGQVNAAALAAGVVDKIMMFFAPKIMGGDDGIPLFKGPGPETMDQCLAVQRLSLSRFGEDILLEGYVKS
jgi:diaminohydroxyphosphoribosylaminopyrimidine deaminase/5-amino-6-(5-phosphoribosylamino)uracil reductase